MRKAVARGALQLSMCAAVMGAGAHSNAALAEALLLPCCNDVETRIAELEATTVRGTSGNLSFRLYGQVNRALLLWKDGFDAGAQVVDNDTSSSRFGFVGQTSLKGGLSAGYRLEIEVPFPSSDEIFNAADGNTGMFQGSNQLRVRQNYWTLTRKDWGGISVGYQSPATDDVTIINLGSQMNDAAVHYNNAFRIRLDLAKPAIITDLTWGQIAHNVDSLRGNFVRYDTPIINGFLLSSALNEDVWDVALRYQKEAKGFRFAGGVGYMQDAERHFEDVRGSASLIHDPTGLYASLAGGVRHAKQSLAAPDDSAYFYYLQLGISKRWVSFGKTTLFGDHGLYKDFSVSEPLSINPDTKLPVVWGTLTQTEVNRWGVGVEQGFDAAATIVYAQAHFYDPKIVGYPCDFLTPDVCGGDPAKTTKLPAAAWQGFVLGTRIQF
jgi:Gram-negative porin